jgi:hypothetical protein
MQLCCWMWIPGWVRWWARQAASPSLVNSSMRYSEGKLFYLYFLQSINQPILEPHLKWLQPHVALLLDVETSLGEMMSKTSNLILLNPFVLELFRPDVFTVIWAFCNQSINPSVNLVLSYSTCMQPCCWMWRPGWMRGWARRAASHYPAHSFSSCLDQTFLM